MGNRKSEVGDRWDSVEAGRWPDREAFVAALIEPGTAVLDVGAGGEGLRERIPWSCRYVPVDRIRRSAETVVVDLDRGEHLPTGFDVVVGLGVIEYLDDPAAFFREAAAAAPELVFSYFDPRYPGKGEWRNRLRNDVLRGLAVEFGWKPPELVGTVFSNRIWRSSQ